MECTHCNQDIHYQVWIGDKNVEFSMWTHVEGTAEDGHHRFCKDAEDRLVMIRPGLYAIATPPEVET